MKKKNEGRRLPGVRLEPLTGDDREQFVLDNQRAFRYGALEEFGNRDPGAKEDGEIISAETVNSSIDAKGAETYRIVTGGRKAGGLVLTIDRRRRRGDLTLLFVNPEDHGRGIGQAAWKAVERMHPEIELWETCTPYFETRNIHFYINRCGFHAVEFFNKCHPEPRGPEEDGGDFGEYEEGDGCFRFEKRIEKKKK